MRERRLLHVLFWSSLMLLVADATAAQPVEEPFLVVPSPQVYDEDALEAIAVDRVRVDTAGWLVVHPEAPRGGPDTVEALGSTGVPSGDHTGLEIVLDARIGEDRTVYVAAYRDEPENGAYDADEDPPVVRGDEILVEQVEVRSAEQVAEEAEGEAGDAPMVGVPVLLLALGGLAAWTRWGRTVRTLLDRSRPDVPPSLSLPPRVSLRQSRPARCRLRIP